MQFQEISLQPWNRWRLRIGEISRAFTLTQPNEGIRHLQSSQVIILASFLQRRLHRSINNYGFATNFFSLYQRIARMRCCITCCIVDCCIVKPLRDPGLQRISESSWNPVSTRPSKSFVISNSDRIRFEIWMLLCIFQLSNGSWQREFEAINTLTYLPWFIPWITTGKTLGASKAEPLLPDTATPIWVYVITLFVMPVFWHAKDVYVTVPSLSDALFVNLKVSLRSGCIPQWLSNIAS